MTFRGGESFWGCPPVAEGKVHINQIWMVNNWTSLKSSQCLGVTKLNPSNFMHFLRVAQKIVRHTKWFHTCTVSLMTSGFYSPATSDCVSFGLWFLKCFSKYFLSVTSYSQRVKVKQSKAKFYLS